MRLSAKAGEELSSVEMSGCGSGSEFSESMNCLLKLPGAVLLITQFGWLARPLPREGWESRNIAELKPWNIGRVGW